MWRPISFVIEVGQGLVRGTTRSNDNDSNNIGEHTYHSPQEARIYHQSNQNVELEQQSYFDARYDEEFPPLDAPSSNRNSDEKTFFVPADDRKVKRAEKKSKNKGHKQHWVNDRCYEQRTNDVRGQPGTGNFDGRRNYYSVLSEHPEEHKVSRPYFTRQLKMQQEQEQEQQRMYRAMQLSLQTAQEEKELQQALKESEAVAAATKRAGSKASSFTDFDYLLPMTKNRRGMPATRPPVVVPNNDKEGIIVLQAGASQYTWEGGQSACAPICLIAAREILTMKEEQLPCLTSQTLDMWVQQGIAFYQEARKQDRTADVHSSVEELWKMDAFAPLRETCLLGDALQGSIAVKTSLEDMVDQVFAFAFRNGSKKYLVERVAFLWTKSGETLLCVGTTDPSSHWFMLDTHGQTHQSRKVATLKRFHALENLFEALRVKYPVQNFGDGSLQAEMYNLFEVTPVICRADDFNSLEPWNTDDDHEIADMMDSKISATPQAVQNESMMTDGTPHPASMLEGIAANPRSVLHDAQEIEASSVTTEEDNKKLVAKEMVMLRSSSIIRKLQENHAEIEGEQKEAVEKEMAMLRTSWIIRKLQEDLAEIMTDTNLTANPSLPNNPIVLQNSPMHTKRKRASPSRMGMQADARFPSETQDDFFTLEDSSMTEIHQEKHETPTDTRKRKPPPDEVMAVATKQRDAASRSMMDKSDYEDPITYQIMSDPVTCEDGQTYERTVIERCFQERIEAEQKRLRRLEGSDEEKEDGDAPRCSAAQEPIELVSPISNEVVSDKLVPNILVDQQIVRYMETNAFGLTPQEVADWRARREEKKKRDAKREQEKKELRRLREERKRNADAAIAKNRERKSEPPDESARLPPALRVRLERDTADEQQTLSPADTGLCVEIAEKGTQIPIEFILKNRSQIRCMVNRCAVRLERHESRWCARCARLVCNDCLAYGVTDFQIRRDKDVKTICIDCVTQLLTAMEKHPRGGVRLQQKRVLLMCSLESHMARCANRASELQERVLSHQASLRYGPQLTKKDEAIRRLSQRLTEVQRQLQDAAYRAESARKDMQHPTKTKEEEEQESSLVEELMTRCEILQDELAEIQGSQPSDSEEEQFQYMERLSDVSTQLEQTRLDLAVALSAQQENSPSTAEPFSASASSTAEPPRPGKPFYFSANDEEEFALLTQHYKKLVQDPQSAQSEDSLLKKAMELSSIVNALEEVQIRLASTRSVAVDDLETEGNQVAESSVGDMRSAEASSISKPESVVRRVQNDLDALGFNLEDWPLPLGLEFPTDRMTQQLDVLRNTLKLRAIESERQMDHDWESVLQARDEQQEAIETDISAASRQLSSAEAAAKEEEERARERQAERQRQEEERQAREAARREEARKAERERRALMEQHRQEENATREAFARVAGENNQGARSFGGVGDLRMCRRCKSGPIENRACSNLSAHNTAGTSYKGEAVHSKARPNECPHCGWFDENWHSWPYWDGVFGPH